MTSYDACLADLGTSPAAPARVARVGQVETPWYARPDTWLLAALGVGGLVYLANAATRSAAPCVKRAASWEYRAVTADGDDLALGKHPSPSAARADAEARVRNEGRGRVTRVYKEVYPAREC